MVLEQLEIQQDEEAIAESIDDGLVDSNARISVSGTNSDPRRIPVGRRIDTLIVTIFPLLYGFPKIFVTEEEVTVVD